MLIFAVPILSGAVLWHCVPILQYPEECWEGQHQWSSGTLSLQVIQTVNGVLGQFVVLLHRPGCSGTIVDILDICVHFQDIYSTQGKFLLFGIVDGVQGRKLSCSENFYECLVFQDCLLFVTFSDNLLCFGTFLYPVQACSFGCLELFLWLKL